MDNKTRQIVGFVLDWCQISDLARMEISYKISENDAPEYRFIRELEKLRQDAEKTWAKVREDA